MWQPLGTMALNFSVDLEKISKAANIGIPVTTVAVFAALLKS